MSTNRPNLAQQLSKSGSGDVTTIPKSQACVLCQQRKIKCNKKNPCSNCLKYHVDCIPASSLKTRPRKKRFPEAELLARLRRYETALQSYGANLDDLNGDQVGAETGLGQTIHKHGDDKTVEISLKSKENDEWGNATDEFRATEELLEGSSEDEITQSPIVTSFNSMYSNDAGGFLFGPRNSNTAVVHPQPLHIFRLWQTFLDNVYPVVKVFHAPTVQQHVFEATTNLEHISKGLEALLFGIYCCAVVSLNNAECESIFGEGQSVLLTQYQSGGQQALLNAEFLKTRDITVLQAFSLLLTSLQFRMDPRSHFCLTGISVRIAQRMGLHRDGSSQRLPPFEVEVRRRLWWQIILFDGRMAELSGAGTSNLSHRWSTRLPLNINDGDLYLNMREPPMEHSGATEMVFCLTKYEIVDFLRKTRSTPGFDCNWHELSTPILSIADKDQAINNLETLLNRKYLLFCKPEIPIQALTHGMTVSALSKMRHIVHHPRLLPDGGASMPSADRDLLLTSALSQISCYNNIYKSRATQRLKWFLNLNAPLEAYIYVLSHLRTHPIGELADQAWRHLGEYVACREEQMMDINHHHFIYHRSPLYFATANLMVKAWEAREAAMLDMVVETPHFVTTRRQDLKGKRGGIWDPKNDEESKPSELQLDTPNSLWSQFDTSTQLVADDSMDWSFWSEIMNESEIPNGGYTFS